MLSFSIHNNTVYIQYYSDACNFFNMYSFTQKHNHWIVFTLIFYIHSRVFMFVSIFCYYVIPIGFVMHDSDLKVIREHSVLQYFI